MINVEDMVTVEDMIALLNQVENKKAIVHIGCRGNTTLLNKNQIAEICICEHKDKLLIYDEDFDYTMELTGIYTEGE